MLQGSLSISVFLVYSPKIGYNRDVTYHPYSHWLADLHTDVLLVFNKQAMMT